MSMLSAQVDGLRSMAVSVGLEVPQAATLMMSAAGTIEKLEAENAKLRHLVHALLQCNVEDGDICAKCSYRSLLHGGCMADVQADELGV